MIRRNTTALVLMVGLTLVGCKGADRPISPSDPAAAPAQTQVSYALFENPVSAALMTTSVQATGGVIPGVACYLNRPSPYVALMPLQTDPSLGSECGVVQDGSSFQGRALVPASYVNNGYTIRIVLFWVPDAGWGAWDY